MLKEFGGGTHGSAGIWTQDLNNHDLFLSYDLKPMESTKSLLYLMFFEEQPGYVDVPTLNCIHKGCEATFVSAVWFILTPRAQTQNNRAEKSHCFKPKGQLTLDHLQ